MKINFGNFNMREHFFRTPYIPYYHTFNAYNIVRPSYLTGSDFGSASVFHLAWHAFNSLNSRISKYYFISSAGDYCPLELPLIQFAIHSARSYQFCPSIGWWLCARRVLRGRYIHGTNINRSQSRAHLRFHNWTPRLYYLSNIENPNESHFCPSKWSAISAECWINAI